MRKNNKDLIKVTFNMRADVVEALTNLAKAQGLSRTQVLHDAVVIDKFLQDERDKGSKVLLEKADRSIVEILPRR